MPKTCAVCDAKVTHFIAGKKEFCWTHRPEAIAEMKKVGYKNDSGR